MKSRHYFLFSLGLALLLVLGAAPSGMASGAEDHDRARQALEAGEVLPLQVVLARVEREFPGQIMEVELEHDDGRWLYEIKMLRAGGALLKLKVDARSGTVIARKGRDAEASHRQGGKH